LVRDFGQTKHHMSGQKILASRTAWLTATDLCPPAGELCTRAVTSGCAPLRVPVRVSTLRVGKGSSFAPSAERVVHECSESGPRGTVGSQIYLQGLASDEVMPGEMVKVRLDTQEEG